MSAAVVVVQYKGVLVPISLVTRNAPLACHSNLPFIGALTASHILPTLALPPVAIRKILPSMAKLSYEAHCSLHATPF
jgi:hypothetical protein